MKIDIKNKNKVLGLIFLVVAVALIIYALVSFFFLDDDKKEKLKPEEQKYAEKIINPQTKENPNIKIDSRLTYDIPEEIKQRIDFEKFNKVMVSFLNENNLWTENTKIISDYTLTENFKTGELSFIVKINNYTQNVILVKIKGNDINLLY